MMEKIILTILIRRKIVKRTRVKRTLLLLYVATHTINVDFKTIYNVTTFNRVRSFI